MPRYIDADELKELLQNLAHDDWNQITCTTWAEAFEEVADMIDGTPTADVVGVVRCKHCKHYDFSEVNVTPYGLWYRCKATGMYTPQIYYCGFGDRREDD